ncbi:DUF4860 domain-containing protein [Desulfosporosinus meridiei]|uniref:Prepilin-type N-terminal cleavage/methylation domain-containing protein n=1 Tax=Desulfosporosinus meridiei (strain ATCC BAA-275 / DSM 13257 / KCTC 12902 / NCIMB 13706 / S10) TaxID=768704 RepID=J7IS39_DESMD|nr:DUF4860 domain-containing protein [Desulfosporosinus meridiei]AFQ43004.1 prepilin-type N-terminal cleavage/methylation domain-containing protein [Desulfosporosinus meridiei DSM 13257]
MESKKFNQLKDYQGYTLVELIVVLAIMAILGSMLVSLMNVGVRLYRTADTAMNNQSNARVALAYVTVKIRQNDASNAISVSNELDSLNDSIYVLKIKDANVSGNTIWIYYDKYTQKLREQKGSSSFDPVLKNGTEITGLKSFKIEKSGITLHFEVLSIDSTVYLSQDITLRSP